MGSEQIEQRNIARDMGINSLAFLAKRQETAALAVRKPPTRNLWYMDAPGATMHEIMNAVSSAHEARHNRGDCGLLAAFRPGRTSGLRRKSTSGTWRRALRTMPASMGVWIVLLAQMNKEGKLFGGNGLRKACDQLYMIEQIEGREEARWIRVRRLALHPAYQRRQRAKSGIMAA